jgi:ELWxxDGT repeat protein
MQFSAVAAVDSAPKVILDVENTSQSTYVTDRVGDMIEVGDKLFFVRDHASNDITDDIGMAELWVSDGTEAGTKLIVQIQHDDERNTSDRFAAVGELLYFFQPFETTSDVIRYELWTSNGTELGTVKVTDIVPDLGKYFDPRHVKGTSSRIFFRNDDGTDEIWTSDGTSEGTSRVEDVTSLDNTAVIGDTLFFSGDATSDMLWRTTDGTSDTTVQVTTTDPGGEDGIREPEVLGDWVYFSFSDGVSKDLWRSNGTPGPGERLTTEDVGSENLTVVGDLLYFTDYCCELWVSNGTQTTKIRSFSNVDEIHDLTAVGDKLFFTVVYDQEDEEGGELWMTGGTLATTELLYNSREYDWDSDAPEVRSSTAVEDTIFFYSSFPQALMTSNGTVAGTLQVEIGIDNDIEIAEISSLRSAGGILYFVSYDSDWRSTLWSFNLNTAAPTGGGSYSAPVLPLATVQTKVVRLTGFNSDSSVLTKKARARMTKAIKKFTAVNSVVCTGFTSGVMATTSQRKLALDRARKACRFVEKLAPDVVVKLKAAPARGTGPKFRAVRVKITGN